MLLRRLCLLAFLALSATLSLNLASAQPSGASPSHVFFRVKAAQDVGAPLSGRLLIFLKSGAGNKEVSISEFHLADTWVCAREIHDLVPGGSIELDADELAFPKPFSQLSAGTYEVQAVLDVNHDYNYRERTPADWISPVIAMSNWSASSSPEPELVLDRHPQENPQRTAALEKAKQTAAANGAQLVEMESPLLTRFWGHSTKIRAWIILPPGYSASGHETYPTVYWTHGFGGSLDGALFSGTRIFERMKQGKMPPMIWVMLDESCPQGTHEFADSVNDGPWGAALTSEFIPYVESKFHMDARRDARFVQGHSSGGWASLQLEINYPKIFGGTWSTSPDPSDFHDFTGIDLYAPHANAYRKPDGTLYPIMRDKGKVLATFEQMSRMEEVIGPYGGQVTSFDWVFSPRSAGGAPEPMFDRATGNVNPSVVAYWREHYDLAHIMETHWQERGADLKGRIHLIVGTADTFYLDGAAHRLDAVLAKLGANAHFTYLPDKTHMNIYVVGSDNGGLFDQIAQEMWDVARPGQNWKAAK